MPSLPDDVIQRTRDKYVEAFRVLTRQRAAVAVREQLDSLVQQMLDRGVRYEDARREFEKVFITRALQRSNGCLGDAAELLGHPPQHGHAEDGRVQDQASLSRRQAPERRES